MALLQWDEKLQLGIEQIDTEHQRLIEIANQLHDAMQAGKGKAVLSEIFSALVEYTTKHFQHEESLFLASEYPKKLEHQKAHAELIEVVVELADKVNERSTMLSTETMLFLKDWVLKHIMQVDQELKPYLLHTAKK